MVEKMTKTQKEKWIERVVVALLSLCVSIAVYSFTDRAESDKALVNKVNQLDLQKADKPYVDAKCLEVKQEVEKNKSELNSRLDRMENKQDKTLDYIIELSQKK